MKSKFSFNIIGPIICFVLIIGAMAGCIVIVFLPGAPPLAFMMAAILVPILVSIWLIFGEFRTKAIVLTLDTDHLTITRYFGFGKPETIYYTDLEGYETSELASINMLYEYLYLVQNSKKIGKISAYYHSNYAELKLEIDSKLKNLGEINFSYWDEIKEIFK